MDPATIALIASAAAGGASFLGQSSANRASAKQAQQQMDFQERMSSTAYQRARADMEAAGINPLVAFSSGVAGASTPVGSSAKQESTTAAGVSSALQAARLKADIDTLKTQADLNRAAAAASRVNAANAALDTPGKRIEAEIDSSTGGYIYRMLDRVVKSLSPFKFGK